MTEHEGRVLCVTCLTDQLEPEHEATRGRFRSVWMTALALGAYFFTAYVFYMLGRFLLRIPSEFHSGVFFE